MDELITGMIENIVNTTSLFSDDMYDVLTANFKTYNHAAFLVVYDIMKDTVFAIGAALVTLFMLMELVQMIDRYGAEADGSTRSIKLPANMLIKFGVFALLYCNCTKILYGIQQIAKEMITNIWNTSDQTATASTAAANLSAAINNLGFMSQICVFIIILIVYIVIMGISLYIQVIAFFRMFEVLIMFSFSPIPLSTIVSQEFRHTALNFLKSFSALCLQSVVILVCFKLYNAFMISKVNSIVSTDISSFTAWQIISTVIVPIIGYVAVLGISVGQSGRISKSLLNAM